MIKRLFAAALALALAVTQARAGTSTITVLDSAGATKTYQVITNGGGAFAGMFGLCDGVAAAQCVAVKAASTAASATDPALVVAISPNNSVAVTGTFWQATQPVSGTFWQATQPISAAALPLPSGAATAAGITTLNTTLGSPFQAGGSIGNTAFGISGTLPAYASTPTVNLGTLNGAATAANQPTNAAQASTTSGQTGPLVQCAVTTGAPTYTTAQTNPLNCDTAGNERVNLMTAIPAGANTIGAVTANAGTNLNTSLLALETGGNLAGINTLAGAKTDAKSTATDATSVSAMQVWKEISAMEQAPASRAVTNAGTFAVQATVSNFPATQPVSIAPLSHASVTSLGTSLVVKASAGNLYGYNCTAIAGAAAGFCVAYNAASVPSTGALTGAQVLDVCYFDTSTRGCSLNRAPNNVAYGTGVVILMTSATTPFTYTTGTDTGFISADYQ